jgi:hypothetical protein
VRRTVDLDADHTCDSDKVDILGQEARTLPPSDRSNHAIDESSRGDALLPATPVDADSTVEVHNRVEPIKMESQQQPTEVALATFVARANENLHDDGFGDRDCSVTCNEFAQPLIGGTFGRSVVLHPSGGIREDHGTVRGGASATVSPMACAPRMARASSRVIG